MEEIQPLNILLTLFTLPKIPRWNNQMGKKSEPQLQKLAILIQNVDKKKNVPIFYLLLLNQMYFGKRFQLKLFHYHSNLTEWNTVLGVIR